VLPFSFLVAVPYNHKELPVSFCTSKYATHVFHTYISPHVAVLHRVTAGNDTGWRYTDFDINIVKRSPGAVQTGITVPARTVALL